MVLPALTALTLIVAAVWLPFGLWKTGLIEDWSFYSLLDSHITLAQALTVHSNRPFAMLGWALGYAMTPNSFVGLNVLHVILMLAKAWLLFAIILALLPRAYFVAFWAAALFMIYPADGDLFATRVTNYHMAVVFYLAAVYCLILYWQRGRRWWLVAAMFALVLDLGTIEVSYPLVLVTPGVLLLRGGKPTRRFWRVMAAWYAVPFVLAVVSVANSLRGGSYQQHVLGMENLALGERIRSGLFHFGRAYYQTLVGVWREVAGAGAASRLYVLIAILVSVLTFSVGLWLARGMARDNRAPIMMSVAGLAVIGLGFLMFLPLPHRVFNEHVFLFSSAGAAMFVAGVGWWFSSHGHWGRVAGTACLAVVTGMSTVGALNLHAAVANLSLQEQHVLASMAEQMPSVPRQPSVVLVFDATDEMSHVIWHIGSSVEFIHSVRYLYKAPQLQVYVCHPESGVWGLVNEACQFSPEGVEITWAGRRDHTYRYDQIIAFQFDPAVGALRLLNELPDDAVAKWAVAYVPKALIDSHASPPLRVHTLLVGWPFKPRLLHQYAADHIEVNFDYSVPGPGWWQPDHGIGWTNSKTSRMEVLLKEGHDYVLEFRIAGALSRDTWDGLSVTANEQPVVLSWTGDQAGGRTYTGRIDAGTIDEGGGLARILFQAGGIYTPQQLGINTDTRHIGLGFDWVRLSAAPVAVPRVQSRATPIVTRSDVSGRGLRIGFDSVPSGSGWAIGPGSQAWMTGPEAVLDLALRGEPYLIRFRVLGALDANVLKTLSVTVGGHPIRLTNSSDDSGARIYEGLVSRQVIDTHSDTTPLVIRVDQSRAPSDTNVTSSRGSAGVGIAFDWFEATPAHSTIPPSG